MSLEPLTMGHDLTNLHVFDHFSVFISSVFKVLGRRGYTEKYKTPMKPLALCGRVVLQDRGKKSTQIYQTHKKHTLGGSFC